MANFLKNLSFVALVVTCIHSAWAAGENVSCQTIEKHGAASYLAVLKKWICLAEPPKVPNSEVTVSGDYFQQPIKAGDDCIVRYTVCPKSGNAQGPGPLERGLEEGR